MESICQLKMSEVKILPPWLNKGEQAHRFNNKKLIKNLLVICTGCLTLTGCYVPPWGFTKRTHAKAPKSNDLQGIHYLGVVQIR